MRRPVAVAALGSVLLIAPLMGGVLAAAAETPGWVRIRTEHFTFVGDEEPESMARIATALETLRSSLSRLAPGMDLGRERLVLYPFLETPSYAPYQIPKAGAGYLVAHEHGVYGAFVAGEEPTRKVFEQYMLHLLERNFPLLPEWFQYGLARLYSTFDVQGNAVRIGLPRDDMLSWLRQRSIADEMPLELVVREPLPPDSEQQIYWLARAWALAHHLLIGDPELTARVPDYLARIADYQGSRRSFTEAFGIEPAALDTPSLDYIRGETLPALRIHLEREPVEAVRAEPLDRAESLFHQADLMLHAAGAAHGARRLLESALELDPELAPAWTALGHAFEQLGDPEAARRSLRRAVELDPEDSLARLQLAGNLLRTLSPPVETPEQEATLAETLGALETAVALEPGNGPAWAQLGYVASLSPGHAGRAREANERALELLPGRTDLTYNLLLATARAGEITRVEELLERLRLLEAAPEVVVRARELLLQLLLKDASRLMKEERLDDAVARLARVRAETGDAQIRATAEDWLGRIAEVEQRNRFASRYNRAVELYRDGDYSAAQEILRTLADDARPGLQLAAVRNLSEALIHQLYESYETR